MTSPSTMPEKIGEIGGHDEKAREGSSTPVIETLVVGARAYVRPRVTDGGGEGTRATTGGGAEDARYAGGLARRKPTGMLRTRLIPSTDNLTFSPFFGTYRWMCG